MNRRTALITGLSTLFGGRLLADDFLERARAAADAIRDRPVVVLYTDPPTYPPCRLLEASIQKYGEVNLPFRIERRSPNGKPIPRFEWGKWYHEGYEPIADFIRRWEHANSLEAATFAVVDDDAGRDEPARVGYPLNPQGWKFAADYINGLSERELESLHDDDHEGRVQWRYVTRPACPT